jgi:hypothetical protein
LEQAIEPPRPSRAGKILEEIVAALRESSTTQGVLVDVEPFQQVAEVLSALPKSAPLPEIVVESESEIGLDWNEPGNALTLTIRGGRQIGFAALLGTEATYGRSEYSGGPLPKVVVFLLGRIYPDERGRRRR